jgi:arylsulfatase A-like enzyme
MRGSPKRARPGHPGVTFSMNRRDFLVGSSQVLGTSALLGRGAIAQPGKTYRPNVIWLIADQWRAQAIGANGDPNAITPNLDRLCSSGINFDQARSGFPLCCPFRGSMLTGRYPNHMVPGHEYPLPQGQETIANLFNDAGYFTGYFGKWHLDGFHEKDGRAAMHIVPPERRGGFKTWVGYENNNSPWDSWVHGGAGKDAFHYRLPGYETDALTDLFIKHIEERAADKTGAESKPFFAVLSVQPPHDPYIAPPKYMGHFNAEQIRLRPDVPQFANMAPIGATEVFGQKISVEELARQELAGYYAQIENWDTNVGRIVETLSRLGLLTNTHIMIFADHGDMHGSHGQFRKTTPYEESTRIPMIVSGEVSFYDQRSTGRRGTLFSQVDIAPTTLGLCGLSIPNWMEGHSYSGDRLRFQPTPSEPDSMYLQNVVATGHPDSVDEAYRGLVTKDGWKYVCFENQTWLMFNLNEDPYEQVNVAFNSQYRAERNQLIARLKQWVADTGDKFQLPSY